MADIEISALATATTLNPTDWFHIKQGAADSKMSIASILTTHNALSNPHGTSKGDVGLANVTNVAQLEVGLNLSDVPNVATARTNLGVNSVAETSTAIDAHANLTNNPHSVTKGQVGLGNVNNWTATSATNDASSSKYATALAVKTVQDNLNNLVPDGLPLGAVILWYGLAGNGGVPSGFSLCDGGTYNGLLTPNLTGKFVRGGTIVDAGKLGGADNQTHNHTYSSSPHTLTLSQIPSHVHHNGSKLKTVDNPTGNSTTASTHDTDFLVNPNYVTGSAGGSEPHSHAMSISAATHNNMPAYYTLSYIMRTS
jgi:hypothetical protein